jgi:hypothetical protein
MLVTGDEKGCTVFFQTEVDRAALNRADAFRINDYRGMTRNMLERHVDYQNLATARLHLATCFNSA